MTKRTRHLGGAGGGGNTGKKNRARSRAKEREGEQSAAGHLVCLSGGGEHAHAALPGLLAAASEGPVLLLATAGR